jgi:hypothetical protein
VLFIQCTKRLHSIYLFVLIYLNFLISSLPPLRDPIWVITFQEDHTIRTNRPCCTASVGRSYLEGLTRRTSADTSSVTPALHLYRRRSFLKILTLVIPSGLKPQSLLLEFLSVGSFPGSTSLQSARLLQNPLNVGSSLPCSVIEGWRLPLKASPSRSFLTSYSSQPAPSNTSQSAPSATAAVPAHND